MDSREEHLQYRIICYKLAIQCCGVTLYFQWAQDEYRKMKKQRRWFKARRGHLRAAS